MYPKTDKLLSAIGLITDVPVDVLGGRKWEFIKWLLRAPQCKSHF